MPVYLGVSLGSVNPLELLLPDAGAEARRSSRSLVFLRIFLQPLDAVPHVILRNHERA